MDLFYKTESYILFGILLGVVLYNAYKRLDRRNDTNRLFLYISIFILMGLVSDLTVIAAEKRTELWLIAITKLCAAIVFIACPIISYLWYEFTYIWISIDYTPNKHFGKLIFIPLFADIIIILISPFTGLMYSIDSNNTYYRGPLYAASPITIFFYLILSVLVIIKNRKLVFRGDFFPLILFGIIPAFGGVTQLLSPDLRLLWPTAAFAIVIVYIYIQQRMMQIDDLTGAWTKGSFEQYLEKRLSKNIKENSFGIIYIDMDDFKNINDSFGHQEGDIALKNVVNLIKGVISSKDIVARVGGDEFIILSQTTSLGSVGDLVKRITDSFDEYNRKSGKKYSLHCSFGYDVYDSKNYTISQFINYVDNLMYRNKPHREAAVK